MVYYYIYRYLGGNMDRIISSSKYNRKQHKDFYKFHLFVLIKHRFSHTRHYIQKKWSSHLRIKKGTGLPVPQYTVQRIHLLRHFTIPYLLKCHLQYFIPHTLESRSTVNLSLKIAESHICYV